MEASSPRATMGHADSEDGGEDRDRGGQGREDGTGRRRQGVKERGGKERRGKKIVNNTVKSFTKVDGISCFYTNADSLVNKIDELKTIVVNNKPQIIAVTEINPKNARFNLQNVEIQIPGYT